MITFSEGVVRRMRTVLCLFAAVAVCGAGKCQDVLEGTYSREVVVFNSGTALPLNLALSPETVVYNSLPALVPSETHSREAVLYVSELPIVDSFSREVVVFDGYYVREALQAIRIAGGMEAATPSFFDRLELAFQMSGQTRINALVAAQVLRIAVSLTP